MKKAQKNEGERAARASDTLRFPLEGENNFPIKHREVLILENDDIGDEQFVPEVVRSLREYADVLEQGLLGHEACDVYEGPRGTRITAIGGCLYYEGQIVRSEQHLSCPMDEK